MKPYGVYFAILLLTLLCGQGQAQSDDFLVVYSNPPCIIEDQSHNIVGESGKPFSKNAIQSQTEIKLTLKAEGYKDMELAFSAEEFASIRRLPAQGEFELEPERLFHPGFLAIPVLVGLLGFAFLRNRSNAKSKPNLNQEKISIEKLSLGKKVGEGATSVIYEGSSSAHPGRKIAIKVLKAVGDQDQNRARLLRSLRSTLPLKHPNLVTLFGLAKTDDGKDCLLMELLEGKTLDDSLREVPRPDRTSIRKTLLALCDVLIYLHEREIMHRDIKPENIFLCKSGTLKLMDLEIAKDQESDDITKTGMGVGTPYYIAPEQAQGQACTQSDQYSVGVIFFQMLAGCRPFPGDTPLEIIRKHIVDPVPSLSAIDPSITALQESVVCKMMTKRPESRFRNMSEARAAIEEALNDQPSAEQTGTVI